MKGVTPVHTFHEDYINVLNEYVTQTFRNTGFQDVVLRLMGGTHEANILYNDMYKVCLKRIMNEHIFNLIVDDKVSYYLELLSRDFKMSFLSMCCAVRHNEEVVYHVDKTVIDKIRACVLVDTMVYPRLVKLHIVALKIQLQWRKSICCPEYTLCKKRLLKEFSSMSPI
jgi:hypothetical protein